MNHSDYISLYHIAHMKGAMGMMSKDLPHLTVCPACQGAKWTHIEPCILAARMRGIMPPSVVKEIQAYIEYNVVQDDSIEMTIAPNYRRDRVTLSFVDHDERRHNIAVSLSQLRDSRVWDTYSGPEIKYSPELLTEWLGSEPEPKPWRPRPDTVLGLVTGGILAASFLAFYLWG